MDIETVKINDIEYMILKTIKDTSNEYLILSNMENEKDIMIRKIDPNDSDYLIALDSDEEFNKIMLRFLNEEAEKINE